jgi:hypothetical protein
LAALTPGPSPIATGEGWHGSAGVRAGSPVLRFFESFFCTRGA